MYRRYLVRFLELRVLVGASGFEPPTSWSRTRRSSQAEPRPVCDRSSQNTCENRVLRYCITQAWLIQCWIVSKTAGGEAAPETVATIG